jgi:hypothetical protein
MKTFMRAVVTVIFGERGSVRVLITTVLKSVTRKRLAKAKGFHVCCGYSDTRIWSV